MSLKHGLVKFKNGHQYIVPSAYEMIAGWQKIPLRQQETYRYQGHRTEILKYLIDHGDKMFEAEEMKQDEYGTSFPREIKITACETTLPWQQEMARYMQGAAASFAGRMVLPIEGVVELANGARELLGRANELTGATQQGVEALGPGRVQRFFDRQLSEPIIVDIALFMPPRAGKYYPKVHDTHEAIVTFSTVAAVIPGLV